MAVSGRTAFTLLLLCGLLHIAAAKVYNVGGDAGWTYQTANTEYYDQEFANITLVPGDGLNFTFTNAHDYQRVNDTELKNCQSDGSNTIFNTSSTFNLTSDGTYNFICTIPGHCSQGMHLTVTVGSAGAPSSPPSSAAPNSPPSSETPNSSPSSAAPDSSPSSAPDSSPSSAPDSSPSSAPDSSPSSAGPDSSPSSAGPDSSPSSAGPDGQPKSTGTPSVVRTGSAMLVGAVLAGCSILLL